MHTCTLLHMDHYVYLSFRIVYKRREIKHTGYTKCVCLCELLKWIVWFWLMLKFAVQISYTCQYAIGAYVFTVFFCFVCFMHKTSTIGNLWSYRINSLSYDVVDLGQTMNESSNIFVLNIPCVASSTGDDRILNRLRYYEWKFESI